jgi:hypothetical protein
MGLPQIVKKSDIRNRFKATGDFSVADFCIFTQKSACVILYEDACERVVLACSMLREMQNRISYVPFAFVMLITVLVLGISSFEVFQGTADKRVVGRVKKSVASLLYLFQSTGYLAARVSVFVILSFQLHYRQATL